MKDWAVIASWAYLTVGLLGLAIPMIWNISKPRGGFLSENAANEFQWLSQEEEERKRLNFHLNREKYLWDYWRNLIDRLYIAQYYCSTFSVVGPILIAALAPLTKDSTANPHIAFLLSLISIHLAITMGLYRSLKIERTLQNGLRFESDFYALFYRFQDAPSQFGKTAEEQINEYLRRYDKIRKSTYEAEIIALPTARDDAGKNPQ